MLNLLVSRPLCSLRLKCKRKAAPKRRFVEGRTHEVARAVLSTHTRVVFRVNDADSRVLGDGFVNFEAKDLRNLEIGSAICRVERSDFDFNLKVP